MCFSDRVWGAWSEWSGCNLCTAQRNRTRICNNPVAFAGRDCTYNSSEGWFNTTSCTTDTCDGWFFGAH